MHYVNFGEIPPFVRIKSVYMLQFWPAIARHLSLLEQFSGNFINSLNLHLHASDDWYKLLGHLSTDSAKSSEAFGEYFASSMEFLPCICEIFEIFKQCLPQLIFHVNGTSNHKSNQQVDLLPLISSILELPSVQSSENVHILFPDNGYCRWADFEYAYDDQVHIISDWLHRPYVSGSNSTPPVEHIRSLTIGSTERKHWLTGISRNNIEQLIEVLKKVSFLSKF